MLNDNLLTLDGKNENAFKSHHSSQHNNGCHEQKSSKFDAKPFVFSVIAEGTEKIFPGSIFQGVIYCRSLSGTCFLEYL